MSRRLSLWQRMVGTPDVASCREVGRVLQSYLDGRTEELAGRRVARHLEGCRRCGLEAETYLEIKQALARKGPPISPETMARLRAFGDELLAVSGDNTPPDQAGR